MLKTCPTAQVSGSGMQWSRMAAVELSLALKGKLLLLPEIFTKLDNGRRQNIVWLYSKQRACTRDKGQLVLLRLDTSNTHEISWTFVSSDAYLHAWDSASFAVLWTPASMEKETVRHNPPCTPPGNCMRPRFLDVSKSPLPKQVAENERHGIWANSGRDNVWLNLPEATLLWNTPVGHLKYGRRTSRQSFTFLNQYWQVYFKQKHQKIPHCQSSWN